MKLNEHEALLTPKALLVPYSEHHVPTYHTWMQDPSLQAATASEPLTLSAEYEMQKSWRTDADKLTFIVCTPPSQPTPLTQIRPDKDDTPESMIGDVNLFLTTDDEHEDNYEEADWRLAHPETRRHIQEGKLHAVVGEVEIMIAQKDQQGKGLGREVLLVFLWYILTSFNAIMDEYHSGHGTLETGSWIKYLRVKIDSGNARSIKLFESGGFKKVSEKPNYFGELELRWPVSSGSLDEVEKSLDAVPRKVAYLT